MRHVTPSGIAVAREALRHSRNRRPEVTRVVEDLRSRREENRFAESIRLAFGVQPEQEETPGDSLER
jgi:hypothetical protein